MLIRTLTAVLGIPLVIWIMYQGGLTLKIAGMIVAMIGVYEFYHVLEEKYKPIKSIGLLTTGLYFIGYEFFYRYFAIYSILFLIILFVLMVFMYPKYHISDIAYTFLGPIYIGVLLSFILYVRYMPAGHFYVWLIFISAWGSDTCAYFTGCFFGKHKLAPVLSPKKTIEGAIGGALGAGIIGLIYTLIYNQLNSPFSPLEIGILTIVVIIGAIFSQIGDLVASAIKRMMNVKDYGHLFPGHGGVMDRFDSVLFVAPLIAVGLMILQYIK